MRIYVASSWRNTFQPDVARELTALDADRRDMQEYPAPPLQMELKFTPALRRRARNRVRRFNVLPLPSLQRTDSRGRLRRPGEMD